MWDKKNMKQKKERKNILSSWKLDCNSYEMGRGFSLFRKRNSPKNETRLGIFDGEVKLDRLSRPPKAINNDL